MLRKRLSMIAVTIAAVAATMLTTAQPAQAERNVQGCEALSGPFGASHMYTCHYTFYGPNYIETQVYGDYVLILIDDMIATC